MAQFATQPLTKERWRDFAELFGAKGACGGCWCMFWRLPRKQFDAQKGDGNRLAMKDLVESGLIPGLLGYLDGRPVGWCSVAPREQFPALARSRVLALIDDQPCWSVSCLFVHRSYRNRGVATLLLVPPSTTSRTRACPSWRDTRWNRGSASPYPQRSPGPGSRKRSRPTVSWKRPAVRPRAQSCALISALDPFANRSIRGFLRRCLQI